MGCAAGGASTVYPAHFPNAEVHAVDLGASMLRYAHARAESIGVPVHFHQRDARRAGFADGSFDLILGHNLFQEIPDAKGRQVAPASLRLVSAGGFGNHTGWSLLLAGTGYGG